MKISEHWLREWIDPPVTTAVLAKQLTMAGLEVDGVTAVAGHFSGVIVAEVFAVNRHPDADRLHLCEVDVGAEEKVSVVCGGKNVRSGMKVAFAPVGAVLPGNFVIKPAKLRGFPSRGMICSTAELGMGEGEPGYIYELSAEAPIGQDLRKYLALEDHIFDIELTPNRGDCLSVQGVARDVAAINDMPFAPKEVQCQTATLSDSLFIKLEAGAACPCYVGRIVRCVNNTIKTPLWMQERLRRSGLRSIHFVVDVMNYVMLELGQPMHAFDWDRLQGDIRVRFADPDESLVLLDKETVELKPEVLVIADDCKALAVAGIMGGWDSAVSLDSSNIFLESAYFDPEAIRLSARQSTLHSDSAYRFERGVDYHLQQKAIERASELIIQYAGGELGPVLEEKLPAFLPPPLTITLRESRIQNLLGISWDPPRMVRILQQLGMLVEDIQEGWRVAVPAHRHDLQGEADLIEEIARIQGYDNIPEKAGMLSARLSFLPETQLNRWDWQNRLLHLGYHQAMTYSFISPLEQQRWGGGLNLSLTNPLSAEMSVMRSSLLPGLLSALQYNLKRQQSDVRLFEWGVCFFSEEREAFPKEAQHLALVSSGLADPEQWSLSGRPLDFFDLKGSMELLLAGHALEWRATKTLGLHPGQSSEIYCQGRSVGMLGRLHPEWMKAYDFKWPVWVAEIDFSALPALPLPHYQVISRFPEVRRDLAFVVKKEVQASDLLASIKQVGGALLKQQTIFDVYEGEPLKSSEKSLAVSLIFVDGERTLVDDEIDVIIQGVVNQLTSEFNAQLRA